MDNAPPISIVQGDSARWEVSGGDYPSSTWTLTYYFVGEVNSDSVVGTPDGEDGWAIALLPSLTRAWRSGPMNWQAKVTDGTDVYTIGSGRINVVPSIENASAEEVYTWAERTLAALEAMIEKKATVDQQSWSIGGRALTQYTPEELLVWRDRMRSEVERQKRAREIARGVGSRGRVLVRM